jgi:hypothetical protein
VTSNEHDGESPREPAMVEVPETEAPAAPVVGVDVAPEPVLMADGAPLPSPITALDGGRGE